MISTRAHLSGLWCALALSACLPGRLEGFENDGAHRSLDAAVPKKLDDSLDASPDTSSDVSSAVMEAASPEADAASQVLLDAALHDAAPCPASWDDAEPSAGDAAVAFSEIVRNFASSIPNRSVTVRWRMGMETTALPLIIAYHGDPDDLSAANIEELRRALPLEAHGRAVFAYPGNEGAAWKHWTFDGRRREREFLTTVVDGLARELSIDRKRVFLVGWGGGAIIVNALSCVLGHDGLAGVAVHSGTIYPLENPAKDAGVDHDFKLDFDDMTYAAPRCDPAPTMMIWGNQDRSDGTSFESGEFSHDVYRRQLACTDQGGPWSLDAVCESYTTCARPHVWCPVPGLDHRIWEGAASVIWRFFGSVDTAARCTTEPFVRIEH